MTDSPDAISLEGLIAQYESGIADVKSGDPTAWLNARTEIEAQADNLNKDQLRRVEKADRELIAKAEDVVQQVASTGKTLAELRAGRDPEQWWWHLDVLTPIGDYYKAKPPTRLAQISNAAFTVLQVAVLLVALFLIGRNLGIIPLPATPTRTPFPTSTPAPTETLNPQALDMSTAQDFKGAHEVITARLPAGWRTESGTTATEYTFSYGAETDPSALIQVSVGSADSLYQIIGVNQSPATSKDALEQFKKSSTDSGSNFEFKDVTPAKIGNLEGFGLVFTIPPGPQAGPAGSVVDIRYAQAQGGKLARLIIQARGTVYEPMQAVIDEIANSVTINAQNIPTPTPTATLHPLLMTATFVQRQILDLTPSPTPTLTPTVTPTLAATAGATGEATAAATSAATSEATAAATVERAPATEAATQAATPAN